MLHNNSLSLGSHLRVISFRRHQPRKTSFVTLGFINLTSLNLSFLICKMSLTMNVHTGYGNNKKVPSTKN